MGPCPPPTPRTGRRFFQRAVLCFGHQGSPLPAQQGQLPQSTAPRRGQLGSGLCPCQQEGPCWGPAVGLFLPGARHWSLDTENSGGNVCFRSRLQASGCLGPQEALSLQSQEDLEPFVGQRHQGGQPSRVVWTDNPPTNPQGLASAPPAPVPVQPPPCAFPSYQLPGPPVPGHHPDSIWPSQSVLSAPHPRPVPSLPVSL